MALCSSSFSFKGELAQEKEMKPAASAPSSRENPDVMSCHFVMSLPQKPGQSIMLLLKRKELSSMLVKHSVEFAEVLSFMPNTEGTGCTG